MSLLDTSHKRKSALLTSIITLLLLLFCSWIGLSYLDPPISYGMEVSFGTSFQGKGETVTEAPQKQIKQEDIPEPEEQKVVTPPPVEEVIEDKTPETLTEKEAPISIDKKKEKPKQKEPPVKKPVEKTPEPPKPKVSKSTKQVLSKILNTPKKTTNKNQQSKGNDEVEGDKGKVEGNPYASSYYTSGLGGNTGYGLNGRNLQSNGKVTQQCNQEGRIVVRITVDKNGIVIHAEAGVKGTTNSHPCLLAPAKETALLHRWTPDAKAPKTQVGFVVINFKLGE